MRLSSTPHERVWGTADTEPWYRNSARTVIGEIWFDASDGMPLLVKILFTSGSLSVQVHPDDAYALTHENSVGKTEMWHILRAAPDARIASGLKKAVPREALRAACLTGEVVELLDWVPARKGDSFYLPAGTIHAIGGGIVACEVQQRSDVTYRLYDYGRGRELHLERGLDVALLEPADRRVKNPALVESPYFRTEIREFAGSAVLPSSGKGTVYVALEGEGSIGGEPFRAGDAFEAPADTQPIRITTGAATFLTAVVP
ncbi:MAG: class I mannose-6-phosphate isomerase [Acidobacteriota bacterium]|nr:class I mannose-6-phosphate isomerase [Acidobacteriota bacterium]